MGEPCEAGHTGPGGLWYSSGFCPKSNRKGTVRSDLHLKRSPHSLIIADNDDMMINACICLVKGLFKYFHLLHPSLSFLSPSTKAAGLENMCSPVPGPWCLSPGSERMGSQRIFYPFSSSFFKCMHKAIYSNHI